MGWVVDSVWYLLLPVLTEVAVRVCLALPVSQPAGRPAIAANENTIQEQNFLTIVQQDTSFSFGFWFQLISLRGDAMALVVVARVCWRCPILRSTSFGPEIDEIS